MKAAGVVVAPAAQAAEGLRWVEVRDSAAVARVRGVGGSAEEAEAAGSPWLAS